MEGNTCCFIGHRKVNDVDSVTERVKSVVVELLSLGVKRYLFGSRSEFNDICLSVVSELKKDNPAIGRVYVRSQYPEISDMYKNYLLEGYDETVFPKGMKNAGRASYVERNNYMIDNSSICVFYYDNTYKPNVRKAYNNHLSDIQPKSGTKIAFEYAVRKQKEIINVFKLRKN
ncbi:MAG: hypothetical protein ACI4MQ_00495 [Candidatus Coproplasma sp.]